MQRQRMFLFGGLLATAVAVLVTGVAASPQASGRSDPPPAIGEQPASPERPARRVLRLDGRGGQLGVRVSDAEGAAERGVRIDAVDSGSAAARAGAQEGDVVVEFDGERVRSARQLTRLVHETPAGRTVKMTVLRGGTPQTLEVTPEAAAGEWNAGLGPELREEIARGLSGLRDLPPLDPPAFDFRFEGLPAVAARGRLGVQVSPLSDQLAGYFGAPKGGVLVSSVSKDSPGDKAGLIAGDVITAVNGTAVTDARALAAALADVTDDASVSLAIVRAKKTATLTAHLARPRRSTR